MHDCHPGEAGFVLRPQAGVIGSPGTMRAKYCESPVGEVVRGRASRDHSIRGRPGRDERTHGVPRLSGLARRAGFDAGPGSGAPATRARSRPGADAGRAPLGAASIVHIRALREWYATFCNMEGPVSLRLQSRPKAPLGRGRRRRPQRWRPPFRRSRPWTWTCLWLWQSMARRHVLLRRAALDKRRAFGRGRRVEDGRILHPSTTFTVTMRTGSEERTLLVELSHPKSLKELFSGGYTKTSASLEEWRGLVPNAGYQEHCNRQGFNVAVDGCYVGSRTGRIVGCASGSGLTMNLTVGHQIAS